MRKLSAVRSQLSTAVAPRRGYDAKGASIPAPVEGWDAISPIAAMSPKRAVQLDNWFPQPDWVEVRRGHVKHSNTGSGLPVETLAKYQGPSSRALFAASGTTIYDVTLAANGVVSRTGMANARFQHINFATTGGNFLYMVNGADDPIYWDGSAWTVATITGTGIVPTDIVNVNAHKNRLWFCFNDSSDVAYLPVDSIQGAAVKFPLGGIYTQGGYVVAMATWSVDAGNGPDDYAVFISSRGQVAIYTGSNPASDFQLVGVFDMGAPLGRRCFTKAGADVALICIDGVVPLSRAMIFERAAVAQVALTQRIQRVMNQSARAYRENFGWQLISYPMGTRIILNVPIIENDLQHQYVMNTLSGAWCRFIGMAMNCWELLDDRLFCGGNDGVVYEGDRGGTDPSATLTADMRTAFNYYGQRGREKRWMQCRPLLTTDQRFSPGLAFNVDFKENAPIVVPTGTTQPGALWDSAIWDSSEWAQGVVTESNWTSVTGLGYCSSIRMEVDIPAQNSSPRVALWGSGLWGESNWGAAETSEVVLRVNSFDLTMQSGSII